MYLGINLKKKKGSLGFVCWKLQTLMKDIKDHLNIRRDIYCVHGLKDTKIKMSVFSKLIYGFNVPTQNPRGIFW